MEKLKEQIRVNRATRSSVLQVPPKELEDSPSPTKVHREPPIKTRIEQGIQVYTESRASEKSPSPHSDITRVTPVELV